MRRAWWATKIIFLAMALFVAGAGFELPVSRADEGGRCRGGSCARTPDNSCYCNGAWCIGCYIPEGSSPGSCGGCVGKPGGDEIDIVQ